MINAAIVGLGRWGKNLVDSVQGKSDHLQFTHGVVRTPSTSRDYAARHAIELSTEFDRVLDDKRIEAVVLTTPHTLHTEQIIAAAQAGKAVFCEKPLALRKADAERAIEACRAAGVVLGLGHNKRFWPSMQELKRLVEDRELGRILHIEGHFSNESTGRFFTGWRGSGVESPGGGLTATGIHVIDAFMGLVGPAQRVTAHSISHESLSAPVDTLTVFMEMANRVSGVLCGVRTTPQFWRVHVFGENGSAEAIEDVDVVVRKIDTPAQRRNYARVDALRLELEAFARAVGGGTAYPIPLQEMMDGVAVLEAAITSLESKSSVLVDNEAAVAL